MKNFAFSTALVGILSLCGLSQSQADTLPVYPTIGTVNPALYSFTIQDTGSLTAYFAGSSASLTDTLSIFDNGVAIAPGIFNNHTTPLGTSTSFAVTAGDVLSFTLTRDDGVTFSSNPASNVDGAQHIYATSFTSSGDGSLGFALPAGNYTYVGFEDRVIPGEFSGGSYFSSDKDYNDTNFLFANTAVSSVPLPAGLPLFAVALLALGGIGYGKKRQSAAKTRATAA